MLECCLRCDYALVCMSVESIAIVSCVMCKVTEVIVEVVDSAIVNRLCDVDLSVLYKCSGLLHRDRSLPAKGSVVALCSKCAEIADKAYCNLNIRLVQLKAYSHASNCRRAFTMNIEK